MTAFRPETLLAIEAVKRALTIVRRGIRPEDVTVKSGRDVVTMADVAIEDAVRGILADALCVLVVGEERGGEESADGSPY
jgi:fructose-1,6-bisphosphatase/inositol monophosphatase family enzyme